MIVRRPGLPVIAKKRPLEISKGECRWHHEHPSRPAKREGCNLLKLVMINKMVFGGAR